MKGCSKKAIYLESFFIFLSKIRHLTIFLSKKGILVITWEINKGSK